MRVLQVIEPLEGGVGSHVADLTRGLVARGHEVEIALPPGSRRAGEFAALGVPLHPVPLVPEIAAVRANAVSLRRLVSVMRAGRFDVVHLQDLKAGALGRPAAAIARVPGVVYTPHGFAHTTQGARGRRGARLRYGMTLGIERSLAPITGRIIAVCDSDRHTAVADGVAPPERFAVVPYGLEDGAAAAPDAELTAFAAGEPLFGCIARLVESKGVDVLMDALVLLRERGAVPRTVIVGNGDRFGDLAAAVDREGLADRVRVLPFSGSVWPRLAALDVFVLPPLHDVFPIAVLEAMAAGCAVVATTTGGIPEEVDDGTTGILVPPGDPVALADAIARLAGDASLRADLGRAGRRRYEERFRVARMVDDIERVYQDLLGTATA